MSQQRGLITTHSCSSLTHSQYWGNFKKLLFPLLTQTRKDGKIGSWLKNADVSLEVGLQFNIWRSRSFPGQRQQAFFLIFIPVAFFFFYILECKYSLSSSLACNFICLLCLVFYFLHQSDLSSVVIVSSVLIAERQLLLILFLVQQTLSFPGANRKVQRKKHGKK